MKINFFEKTDVGRVRKANEDNMGHLELPWGWVFTVCDGMGGHVGGATASSIAVNSILEFLGKDQAPSDPAEALAQSLIFANEQIYATTLAQPELRGMGTTAVIMLQIGSSLWLAHVGDSRIYIHSEGRLHRLTRDHSFVQTLVDQGIISEDEMELHPRKNELTRALGTRPSVEPEVSERPVHPQSGDTFLLCSDGLYGMIDPAEILSILQSNPALQPATERLIFEANERGGHDNITVQLVRVEDSPHAKSRFDEVKVRADLAHTQPGVQSSPGPAANQQGEKSFFQKPAFLVGATAIVVSLVFLLVMTTGGGNGGGGGSDTLNTDTTLAQDSLGTDTLTSDTTSNPTDTSEVDTTIQPLSVP